MFPSFSFDPLYSPSDRKLIEYISKQVIREYARKLKPFNAWENQVKQINVVPSNAPKAGICNFRTDTITLYWPVRRLGALELAGWSYWIAHEVAHHFVQEFFGDSIESNYLGVSLVHFAHNSSSYLYPKRYWSPTMWKRIGWHGMRITMMDVKNLVNDKDWIMDRIRRGAAPQGLAYSI